MEKFLDLLVNDDEVRSEFFSKKSAKEAYNVAKKYMKDVSYEEFFEKIASLCSELKDEDLENVAGGSTGFNGMFNIIPCSFRKLFVK